MKGKLVQDKTRNGFRAIVQHDESKNQFYPTYPNTEEWVEIIEASPENLRMVLNSVLEYYGVKNSVIENPFPLAEKLVKEVVSYPLIDKSLTGSIAYNETSFGPKFFLILQKVKI